MSSLAYGSRRRWLNPGSQDNMAGNVVDYVKGVNRPVVMGGDWNLNVNNDPKNIGEKTGPDTWQGNRRVPCAVRCG